MAAPWMNEPSLNYAILVGLVVVMWYNLGLKYFFRYYVSKVSSFNRGSQHFYINALTFALFMCNDARTAASIWRVLSRFVFHLGILNNLSVVQFLYSSLSMYMYIMMLFYNAVVVVIWWVICNWLVRFLYVSNVHQFIISSLFSLTGMYMWVLLTKYQY